MSIKITIHAGARVDGLLCQYMYIVLIQQIISIIFLHYQDNSYYHLQKQSFGSG